MQKHKLESHIKSKVLKLAPYISDNIESAESEYNSQYISFPVLVGSATVFVKYDTHNNYFTKIEYKREDHRCKRGFRVETIEL